MLASLRIENFAIVSTLELDFENGMTAFTGETGAGKSIMIDALLLALGERADASVVRPGTEKCDICACFHFDPNTAPAYWLNEHDIAYDEPIIYLRRVIYAEGRSKSYINGQPFPLQKVKALSECLVDIHGQHQHQSLLQHATHRIQLDQFSNHSDLLQSVEHAYGECKRLEQALQAHQQKDSHQERCALLRYQIEELSALNPLAGEMQALHEEHQLLHHACDYLQHTQTISTLLSSEDTPDIGSGLNQILQLLQALPQENAHIRATQELINNALILCEEALREIMHFGKQVPLDPERLQEVESRLSALHQAARKYQVDANQLHHHLIQLEQELSHLQNSEQQAEALKAQYDEAKQLYEKSALALRHSRQKHAKKLADEISETIRQLGMPHGYITLEFTPLDTMHRHGLDKVEYLVCSNPGMSPASLGKIASGGELSRISLAIQLIAAKRGATPTLLFDEVDVGIGGATAALVGQLLRQLGERLQLFCVTHQPQVASAAHHHFIVEKHTENQQTYSNIKPLQAEEKVHEIARMLGGLTITEQTRSHARELLQKLTSTQEESSTQ